MQIMPFEEARTYRFNPFDLTKVWPHGDYPLIKVGTMTLNRNVTDFHTEMEQAAFEPNNLVPGIGLSPDKMLLARGFSYADAHRARLGVNYKQIPVNTPHDAGAQLQQGRRRPHGQRQRSRLRAQLLRRPGGRSVADRRRGPVGGRRRHGPLGLHAAGRRRRLRPGRHAWSARSSTTTRASGWSSNVAGHLSDGVSDAGAGARVRVLEEHRRRRSASGSSRPSARPSASDPVVTEGASGSAPGACPPSVGLLSSASASERRDRLGALDAPG